MNKKFLNILLILIVSLSVLSGCSAGENNFFNDLDKVRKLILSLLKNTESLIH